MSLNLHRTVITLGLVSLFTDFSSEMIYPFLPVFLTTVLGAGAASLGVIEGVVETTAALGKVFFGYLSDKSGGKKKFLVVGCGLASADRPLIGLAGSWPVVLFLRFSDRVGKGIRTAYVAGKLAYGTATLNGVALDPWQGSNGQQLMWPGFHSF
jgi:MFS family permease